MSTTRPRKDSIILAPIDIGDQPYGEYIFLTEGVAGTQAFSVNRIEIADEVVFARRNHALIIAVPVRSPWTVVARDAVIFRTLEESMQKQKADRAQEADLIKTVFGEATTHSAQPKPSTVPLLAPSVGHYF